MPGGMGVKVAVVGGGSTYTPELVEGFVTRGDRLPVDELVLLDIDPERLAIVGALARADDASRRLVGRTSRSPTTATKRSRARDFVIVQLRVGGQAARFQDETIPPRFGCIGQETTGPGGFAKALRTVPDGARARRGDGPTRRAGRLVRRLHEPDGPRDAGAAGRGSSCARACATSRSASSVGSRRSSGSNPITCSSSTSG